MRERAAKMQIMPKSGRELLMSSDADHREALSFMRDPIAGEVNWQALAINVRNNFLPRFCLHQKYLQQLLLLKLELSWAQEYVFSSLKPPQLTRESGWE